MRKSRRIILFLTISLLLFIVSFQTVSADGKKQRIYDFANVLSDKEVEQLEEIAETYSKKRKTDFVIVTTPDSDGKDIRVFMEDFYDNEKLGFEQENGNAAMLTIDMKNRDVMLTGFQKAEERLPHERLTNIRQQITPDLSNGKYYQAFESFIKLSAHQIKFRPGVDPDNPLFHTWTQLVISIVIGAMIVWMMARNVKTKITTTAATYRDAARTRIVQKRDKYIRTTVTKRRRPKQNNSSGGGSSLGGGGFTGGRTSGGHSYSGSRGKF